MRLARPLRLILAALTLGHFASVGFSAEQPKPTGPWIVAHRGLLLHAPEDTLANFQACLALRLGFEFDVQRTKDGRLVCIHDNTVDRTTNGTGRVVDMTFDQIRRLDAGSWFAPEFAGEKVPTIDEVFQLIAVHPQADVLIAVDIKAKGVEADLIRLAKQHDVLNRLLFIGRTIGEPAVRARLRENAPEAHTATVANNPAEFPTALQAANSDWVYVRYLPSQKEVAAVHAAEKRVFIAGTPIVGGHLPDNWRQATTVGVDGILTDHPLKLRATLSQSTARSDH